ncbi:MAG: response regulator transcription factor [Syntrophomonadaceae bacterium]|jgi:two-component system response regulator CssR|nr:response regulator transcription factor [Syntrophomonadaceae bacterium]
MSYRIYLVEDEENLNELLSSYLSKEGWQVQPFLSGEKAMQAIPERPDLWILDIMLPDIDGYRLLQYIKADDPSIPVIYISARDAELDRVLGLEMGSDDYLPKPFLPRELVIRTRKLLERVYTEPQFDSNLVKIDPYLIDEQRRKIMQAGYEIDLTSKEFDLMVLLARNQGQAFSREQVLDHVWGTDYVGSDRVVDDLVRRLRKKLPEFRVETIYGYGYRLVKS